MDQYQRLTLNQDEMPFSFYLGQTMFIELSSYCQTPQEIWIWCYNYTIIKKSNQHHHRKLLLLELSSIGHILRYLEIHVTFRVLRKKLVIVFHLMMCIWNHTCKCPTALGPTYRWIWHLKFPILRPQKSIQIKSYVSFKDFQGNQKHI